MERLWQKTHALRGGVDSKGKNSIYIIVYKLLIFSPECCLLLEAGTEPRIRAHFLIIIQEVFTRVMKNPMIPEGYHSALNLHDTQVGIKTVKDFFQNMLAERLNLLRVSAPLFVDPSSGLNDNLNGVERPVDFDILEQNGRRGEVVQSLAKWKRYALKKYGFQVGEGLYTDMSAIRRDEVTDNIHSIYVDQWDWEKVITARERNLDTLKTTVQRIVNAIYVTNETLKIEFPKLSAELPREIVFLTTQELADRYPELDRGADRETAFCAENRNKVVFLMQIGGRLRSGERHDGRAPDYDDWSLNGDILYWNPVLERSFEISSMGVRVDADALRRQLREAGCEERASLPFHRALLEGKLPLTIGGGIGQSRLCMLMMGCAHIGEVQSSIWDAYTRTTCENAGVMLL